MKHVKTEAIPKVRSANEIIAYQQEQIKQLQTIIDNLRGIIKDQDNRLLQIKQIVMK